MCQDFSSLSGASRKARCKKLWATEHTNSTKSRCTSKKNSGKKKTFTGCKLNKCLLANVCHSYHSATWVKKRIFKKKIIPKVSHFWISSTNPVASTARKMGIFSRNLSSHTVVSVATRDLMVYLTPLKPLMLAGFLPWAMSHNWWKRHHWVT